MIRRPAWQHQGLCWGSEDPELWFEQDPPEGVSDSELELWRRGQQVRQDQARAICAECPVKGACLAFAMRTRQKHGVWGGVTGKEIEAQRRRSRKAA